MHCSLYSALALTCHLLIFNHWCAILHISWEPFYQFRTSYGYWVSTRLWPTSVRHTLIVTLWPSTLEVMALVADSVLVSIRTQTLKFLGLTVRKIWHILCVCISRPVTLTFDLETGAQFSTYHGVPCCQFWWYYDYCFRFMRHWANTAQIDHVTLRPWPLTLAPVADAGCLAAFAYQVWSS